jgi:hypothetical protein
MPRIDSSALFTNLPIQTIIQPTNAANSTLIHKNARVEI